MSVVHMPIAPVAAFDETLTQNPQIRNPKSRYEGIYRASAKGSVVVPSNPKPSPQPFIPFQTPSTCRFLELACAFLNRWAFGS